MKDKDELKKWIVTWFSAQTGRAPAEIQAHADENYFELGYLDSFGFIELVETLEETQQIVFRNDSFEDRSFATINGLANICAGAVQQGE